MKFLKTTLLSGLICSLLISGMAYGDVPTSTPEKGLGLGANPPTQEEIDWANKTMSKNHPIRNNKLAIKRINDELKAKGRSQMNPNSAVPMGKEVSTQADATSASASTSALASTSTSTSSATAVLPSFVDNSTLACFPPIGNQNPLGSCVAFSSTYYQLTHMTGLVRNWDAKNDPSNTKKFSPRWTYNLGNHGVDHGMNIVGAYQTLSDDGAVLWADFPYDASDYKQWCLTNGSWTNAAKYRADQKGSLEIVDSSTQSDNDTPVTSPTDPDLSLVKNYLNNGYILSFATYVFSWQFLYIGDDQNTTADDAFVGKRICYARATNSDNYTGAHEMTIVGYNDNIWTDINNDGIVQECEKGAFKVANSWGAYSSNNMDNGFYWVAYDALNRVSAIDKFNNDHPNEMISPAPAFAHRGVVFNNYNRGYESIENNTLYWITAKESYNPSLMAKFMVSHSKRSQMKVELGYSDTNTTTPVITQAFGALNYAGGGYPYPYNYSKDYSAFHFDYSGDYAFDGTGDGTGNTICNGIFTLDFTDIIKNNNIAPGTTKRWYLIVTDGSITPDDGKAATVKYFSLTDSSEHLLASTGAMNQTVNGSTTTVYLDYALGTSQSAWVNKTNAAVYRCGSASASYNNEIYIAGGYDGNCTIQNSLWSYNPATETWTEKAQMATPRIEAGAATVLNKIYVVGGFNNTSLNSIEEYNPSNNTWTTKTSMNTPRNFLGVAAANGKIYAIGGMNNGTTLNTVEEYDPTTNTWTTKAEMPTARHSFGIASYNGKIYVIGGRTAANTRCTTVEVYDPLNDTWDTARASMPTARDELACAAYNGKIYAIGGCQSGGGVSGKTEVYDPSTNTWTPLADLNNARTMLSVACANDKLYAIGGDDSASNVSNKVEEYIP